MLPLKNSGRNSWKRIVNTSEVTEYQNRDRNIVSIVKLEDGVYQTKPKYQVNFNKYILGIFRKKCHALGYVKRWMDLHSQRE
jgi:hypothetical protein